jgi:hypothetical protein
MRALSDEELDRLADRLQEKVVDGLLEKMLVRWQVPPRYLTMESAGRYIDKTAAGMRSTIRVHEQDLPVVYVGHSPRIDRQDIDRLCAKLKEQG